MQVCVALDVENERELEFVISKTWKADLYKVGPVLLSFLGEKGIERVSETEKKVFLDMKFFDIASVVAKALEGFARKLDVKFATVHLRAPDETILKAKEIGDKLGVEIVGVGYLTSEKASESEFEKLFSRAKEFGIKWVVCPAKLSPVAKKLNLKTISPGIRLEKNAKDEHIHTSTPQEAMQNQVDVIVVGRPVVKAADPEVALKRIFLEIGREE